MLRADRSDERKCLLCLKPVRASESFSMLLGGAQDLCAECLDSLQAREWMERRGGKWICTHYCNEEGELDRLLARAFGFGDVQLLAHCHPGRRSLRLLENREICLIPERYFDAEILKEVLCRRKPPGKRKDGKGKKRRDAEKGKKGKKGLVFAAVSRPDEKILDSLCQDPAVAGIWIFAGPRPPAGWKRWLKRHFRKKPEEQTPILS